ncbi:MAG: ATP-binding protein [Gemmatimonadetes bacterium]|nr:ATP-binding protein [Gemmatimonadota bacterium]
MTFRSYHQVPGADRSGLLDQVLAQRARVTERLARVRRVVAVMSGKGGVGKSHVTALLARGAANGKGRRVGVLDADLKSPTCARMLGAQGPVRVGENGAEPVVGIDGVRLFSSDLLLEEGKPLAWKEPDSERFLWRGALETGALREFLSDVAWGDLDLLLIDLPPGADRLADLAALVPGITGTVAVTIPSEESRRSVERSIRTALDAKIPVLGIVENMSGYACEHCYNVGPLFEGNAGEALSETFRIPLLGKLPFGHEGHKGHEMYASHASAASHASLVDAFLGVLS